MPCKAEKGLTLEAGVWPHLMSPSYAFLYFILAVLNIVQILLRSNHVIT